MESQPSPVPAALARPRKRRLGEEDWIRAALDALVEDGIEGVRVDTLARRLGVTKGSFYWHFKNRDQLLAELALSWGEKSPDKIIKEVLSAPGDPKTRLALFGVLYRRGDFPKYDRAMRAWAMTDPRAAAAVEKANAQVADLLAGLYEEMGFDNEEAAFRAQVQILCGIGMLFAVEYEEGDLRKLKQRFLDFMTRPPSSYSNVEVARAWSAR